MFPPGQAVALKADLAWMGSGKYRPAIVGWSSAWCLTFPGASQEYAADQLVSAMKVGWAGRSADRPAGPSAADRPHGCVTRARI